MEAADPLAHFRIGNAFFALKKYSEARKVGPYVCLVFSKAGCRRSVPLLWQRPHGCLARPPEACPLLCPARRPASSHPQAPSSAPPPASQAFVKSLKCCRVGEAGEELAVKVYVNLGITQEAEGLLMSACDYYK